MDAFRDSKTRTEHIILYVNYGILWYIMYTMNDLVPLFKGCLFMYNKK